MTTRKEFFNWWEHILDKVFSRLAPPRFKKAIKFERKHKQTINAIQIKEDIARHWRDDWRYRCQDAELKRQHNIK